MNLEDFIELDLYSKEIIIKINPFTDKKLNRPKIISQYDLRNCQDNRSEITRLYNEKIIPLSKELAEAKKEIRELKDLKFRKKQSQLLQKSESKRLRQIKEVLDHDGKST